MPAKYSRYWIRITGVGVQKLHDIDDIDVKREGFADLEGFKAKWEEINGRNAWSENPYVWVYSFVLEYADKRMFGHNADA